LIEQIVVDTNVIAHADNPISGFQRDSKRLLIRILQRADTHLAFDRAPASTESSNQSQILCEYLEHVNFATPLGQNFLKSIFESNLFAVVGRTRNQREKKIIIREVSDKLDRLFLRVACMTNSRKFFSHDFDDFPQTKRTRLKRELRISFFTARNFD